MRCTNRDALISAHFSAQDGLGGGGKLAVLGTSVSRGAPRVAWLRILFVQLR